MTNGVPARNIAGSGLSGFAELSLEVWNTLGRGLRAWSVLLLAGCSSLHGVNSAPVAPATEPAALVLATPLQVTFQSELALARLGQLLGTEDLNPEQRAELYYERGVIFDRVGLRTMARIDFNRALRERPDFAEAYNFIGVYLTQQQNFDEAYDAFDSALELSSDYDYAYLNRGIALYYGHRPALAVKDLSEFYRRKPEDPYRVLWLFLAESQLDAKQAMRDLQRRYAQRSGDEWGWKIVAVYAGEQPTEPFLQAIPESAKDNRELAERLCEAYFYLGKQSQAAGRPALAASYFKLALASNVYDFIEHRYAMLELQLMDPRQEEESR